MATGKPLGKWEVKDCRRFRALSICKKRTGPAEPEEAAPKPGDPCPEGWHNFPSSLSCYKVKWHSHLIPEGSCLSAPLVHVVIPIMHFRRHVCNLPECLGAQSPARAPLKLVSDSLSPHKLISYLKEQDKIQNWLFPSFLWSGRLSEMHPC